MLSTNPVRSLRSRVRGAPPAQVVIAAFAAMALVAGTWLAFGSAPARAVVGYGDASNPAVAFMSQDRVPGTRCTGVLISTNEILTAGHCVEDGMALGRIGSGSSGKLDGSSKRFVVTGGRVWDQAPELGVLSISPPITDIAPVNVDTSQVSPAPGAKVRIFGYGYSGSPGCWPYLCRSDGQLRAWNAEVQSSGACVQEAPPQGGVCMLPVANTTANGCAGDSGGPVYDSDTLKVIGVYFGELGPSPACYAHAMGAFISTAGAKLFLFG